MSNFEKAWAVAKNERFGSDMTNLNCVAEHRSSTSSKPCQMRSSVRLNISSHHMRFRGFGVTIDHRVGCSHLNWYRVYVARNGQILV